MTEADRSAFSEDFDFYDIETIAKGYSKTRGIQIIQEHYGITRENTVAIGDSDSDWDMISYAGIGIAMGNAEDAIKEIANWTAPTNDEEGVAYTIRTLLFGEPDGMPPRKKGWWKFWQNMKKE